MSQGLQNPDLSLDQLYDQATRAQPELKSYGENLLHYLQEKYPGQFDGVPFEQAPLKEIERIQDKITADYNGDHTKIADIVRGRLLVETPEQIEIIRREMTALQQDMRIEKYKDFYAEPLLTHFRTLNTQVRLPNGHIAEFRIDQIDMSIAGNQTHDLYEEMQKIERTAKLENRPLTEAEIERWELLLEEQRTELDRASNKANLDSLLNEKGVATLQSHRSSRLEALTETFGKLGRNGNVIAGVTFGTLSSAFALASGSSKAEAAKMFYESAVPYGETQLDLARADMDAAARSTMIETASNIGSIGGTLAGIGAGTAIGSVIPGVGNAGGAIIGGIIGSFGGGFSMAYLMEKIHDNYAQIKSGATRLAHATASSFTDSVQDTKQLMGSWFKKAPALDVQIAFNRLPDSVTPDMPPEVAALVEVKASRELFEKSFEEIEQHSGLSEVMAYLEAHPPEAKQPAPVAEGHPVHHTYLSAPGLR